jgi:hypothetical protein
VKIEQRLGGMDKERAMLVSMLVILSVAVGYFVIRSEYSGAVHDVSIVYASVSKEDNIIVVTKNGGNRVENFNVTAYRNGTVIDTKAVTELQPGADATLTFLWNTTSLPYGMYVVSAVASTVPGETNTSDNSMNTTTWIGANHNVSIPYADVDKENNIVAIARNEGNRVENFNVTAYRNGTVIDTKAVTELQRNTEIILKFPWDTTCLSHDMYLVSVVANTVPNETDTRDNSFAFLIEKGSLWSAVDYFNFTATTVEASMVGSGVIQVKTLRFNITAIRGDAHNVTIFVNGMTDFNGPLTIFNQTSEYVDIDFRIPYQTTLGNNSAYPVEMTISGAEIDPHKGEVTLPVPPPNGSSYTIWRGGDRYYAKNDWSELINYYGANFTHVFEQVLNTMPADGGTIHLEPGYYEGWMVINRSGIIVQGGGAFTDNPLVIPNGTRRLPDDSPRNLMGTVLMVGVAGRDGIHLTGQLNGVHIRDLGIEFTQTSTGHGISDDMDQNFHLSYCSFENIMVLNHDRCHYAIQMSNFLHLDFRDIWVWGGPLLNLYGNMGGFQSGNSNFYNLYGYIKYDLAPIEFVQGSYPIFVHKNDSLSSVWVNFLHFYRIQINCPFVQSDPGFYEVTLWDCRSSMIEGLDLEGSGNGYDGNKLRMGSCYNNEFINAYIWSQVNNVYVNIASNNVGNTFDNCWICAGTVLDSCPTDEWHNPILDATIHKDSTAHFVNLLGNSGIAKLTSGSSEVNVTAKFIGADYSIILQPVSNASESLTVEATYRAPSNSFTVKCTDGQPASKDIDFAWWVWPWKQAP